MMSHKSTCRYPTSLPPVVPLPLSRPLPFLPDSLKIDFLGETDHFIHALKEGLKSLVGGLELRGVDPVTRESSEGLDTRNFTQARISAGVAFVVK